MIGGSGFLAVYLVGLAVGSTPSRYRRQLVAFHEGLAFLAQVALFVVLGLLVFPSELPDVALPGPGARVPADARDPPGRRVGVDRSSPASPIRDRLLLGWAGLRGAVPIVLATFVLSSDVPHKDTIFNAVFFVVVVSTIVQGTTLEWVAGRLGLLSPAPPVHEAPLEVGHAEQARPRRLRRRRRPRDRRLGRPRARPAAKRARSPSINRGRATRSRRAEARSSRPGDRLFVLVPRELRADLEDVFSRWRRRV